ncbi:MAG: hypothetical protein IT425_05075 [Pirellulales bacterium]|nr:hypothetical protein [Pirellulales bacterium]
MESVPRWFAVALLRFVVALLPALVPISERAWGCGNCACCRIDPLENPGTPIGPYIYGENPLDNGTYEVGQQAPAPGGVGSTVIPIEPGSWSLVVMPDTQLYSQTYPQHFNTQTQWIKDNAAALNIKYALHEGDIVNVAADTAQWTNARNALDTLNGFVPYALAPGNHDYGGQGNNRTTLFDNGVVGQNYFGVGTPYASQPSIGGFYQADGPNKTDNSWHTFNANGQDWIVVTLEWGPRDAVLQWADQVLTDHPNHNGIVVTHAYMYYDDTIYDWATKGTSQSWNPHAYGIESLPGGVNDGQEIWDGLVKKHENMKFVFNGHVLGDGTGKRATLGDNGNVVHQMLANYQFNTQGGQGDMRVLEFKADGETVVVRTYSPSLDRYNTAADQQFTLNMNSTIIPGPPPIGHAVAGNMIATGPTDPSTNTVDSVTVPQFSAPGVGTGQLNRGDFQPTIGGGAVTYTQGIMLASISQHSRADFEVSPGVPRRASVEVGRNPYGDGNLSLSIMEAGGSPVASSNEVNFNTSIAWFPFSTGFRGAHVDANGTVSLSAANGVSQAMVSHPATGRYTVNLGVNSLTDGMLFTIGNNNENILVQTGPAADGSNWDIRVAPNSANHGATGSDKDWSFLYLPYATPDLVGGYFDGFTTSHIGSAGSFTMAKTATGQYELTIPGQTPDTGMLILSVAYEATASGVTAPDDNVLTYGTGTGGKFTINSYDLPNLNFQDTKFVWAFVSFADPLEPYVIPGDYNRDALVDNVDYQVWRSQYGETTGWLSADGNGDGIVDTADYVFWRKHLAGGPGSGTGAAAVIPEPMALALVALALTLAPASIRHRHRLRKR